MKTTVHYQKRSKLSQQKAAADMESFILPQHSDDLAYYTMVDGATLQVIRLLSTFAGVTGFPVKCWWEEVKELYAAW